MIFALSSTGQVLSRSAASVGRYSNGADKIYILAPYSDASIVRLVFTLPDGTVFSNLTDAVTDTSTPFTASYITQLYGDYGLWEFAVPLKITQQSGTVDVNIMIYFGDKTILTADTSFMVDDAPALDYDELHEMIGIFSPENKDITNDILEALSRLTGLERQNDQKISTLRTDLGNVEGQAEQNKTDIGILKAKTEQNETDIDVLYNISYKNEAKDPANKILERLTINEVAYYDSIVTCIDDLNNGRPAADANEKSDRSECFIYLKGGTFVIVLLRDIFPLERLYIKVPIEFVFAGHRIIVASSNVTAGLTCNGSYTYINGTMGGGVYVENPKTSSWCICAGPSVTKFIVDGGEYTIKGKDPNTGSAKAIETYNSDCITEIRNARIDISGVGNIVLGCNFVDKATVKDSDIKIHTTSSTSARGILAQNDINIENCNISTVATVGTSSGVSVEKGRATVVACNIEADSSNNVMDDTGTYGCALKVYPEVESCSISYGTYTGTHSAVGMMSNDFRAFGATFYSCAHGGIYFSGQKAYVKDCIIGCRAYNGRFDFSSMENDLLGDFYIGSNSDCTVYMDNCVLTGEGNHCGVLRGSGGEKRNILYISRTAIPDGKQFRIDSGNYMVAGEGSDVDEAQVTLPSALSTTAYIYDYEHMCANEVSESMTAYVDNKLIATFPLSKEVTEAINDLSVRVSNLESLSLTYVEDTAISYEKLVPAEVGKYSLVKSIGSIVKKSHNLLNVADATAVAYERVTIDGDVIKVAPASSIYGIEFLNASEIFEVGKTYYFTASPSQSHSGAGFRFDYTDKSKSEIRKSGVLTVEKEISSLCYYINWGTGFDAETTISNIQAVEGDVDLPYEPYWEGIGEAKVTDIESRGADELIDTFHIPEAVQAIHGYGWGVNESANNYIDFEKQQFVQSVEKIDLGSLTWSNIVNGVIGGYNTWFQTPIENIKPIYEGESATLLCEKYDTLPYYSLYYGGDSGIAVDSNGNLAVLDNAYSDVTSFKEAMNGVFAYIELAEPIITDISDLLSSDNFIEVEGGGNLRFVNEYKMSVPNNIAYVMRKE